MKITDFDENLMFLGKVNEKKGVLVTALNSDHGQPPGPCPSLESAGRVQDEGARESGKATDGGNGGVEVGHGIHVESSSGTPG